jgi:hypothetical protein
MALGIIILYQVLPVLLIISIIVSFILIRKSPSKLRWIALCSNVLLFLLWFHYLGREVFDRSISSATAPKIELQASKNFHQPIIIIRVTNLDQTPQSKMIYPLKDSGLLDIKLSSNIYRHPHIRFTLNNGLLYTQRSKSIRDHKAWFILSLEYSEIKIPHFSEETIEKVFSSNLDATQAIKLANEIESDQGVKN